MVTKCRSFSFEDTFENGNTISLSLAKKYYSHVNVLKELVSEKIANVAQNYCIAFC